MKQLYIYIFIFIIITGLERKQEIENGFLQAPDRYRWMYYFMWHIFDLTNHIVTDYEARLPVPGLSLPLPAICCRLFSLILQLATRMYVRRENGSFPSERASDLRLNTFNQLSLEKKFKRLRILDKKHPRTEHLVCGEKSCRGQSVLVG